MAAVAGDDEVGVDVQHAVGTSGADADHSVAFADQVGGLGAHQQAERRKAVRLVREEVEEIPLRHQGDELRLGRQVGEIGDLEEAAADLHAQRADFAVGPSEERVQQAEFVHHLHGGGMHGVAAEIAQEVGVLFQHDHIDAGAREQEAEHHPGRPAADDAAAGRGIGHVIRRPAAAA